jgi:hypothetical protein
MRQKLAEVAIIYVLAPAAVGRGREGATRPPARGCVVRVFVESERAIKF